MALNKVFEIQHFNSDLLLNIINGSVSFNHHLVGPFRQVMSEFVKIGSFRNELKQILKNENLPVDEKKYLEGLLM